MQIRTSTCPARRLRVTRRLVACGLIAASALAAADERGPSDWRFATRENDVEVATRPVAGSGIREFRGETEIAVSPDRILTLLRDADRFHTWFPNCPESKSLGRQGDVAYQYSVMATPWPIADRDNVFRSVTRRDHESGRIEIEVRATPDRHPVQPGRVRVEYAKGSWVLLPLDERRTRVTFRMHLEPGGGIPDWMINARIRSTPIEALSNLRAALEE